jgi:uncharacterized protein YbcV (DUF1398 family)
MSEQVKALLEACSRHSENDVRQLRQQRQKLAEAGIEGYYADLYRSVRIYFLRGAEPIQVACPKVDAAVARTFETAVVEAAIQRFRAGGYSYRDFCAKVMTAGCVGYLTSFLDRFAVYFGRTAETVVERFPDDPHCPE